MLCYVTLRYDDSSLTIHPQSLSGTGNLQILQLFITPYDQENKIFLADVVHTHGIFSLL